MSNLTDVTDMTPAAFEVYFAAATGDDVDADHLTSTERRMVADALGWYDDDSGFSAAYLAEWVAG